MNEANGLFTVRMAPTQPAVAEGINGLSLNKTYTGDLQGTGTGQMLSAGDPKTGNAGYVAIERITGTLRGRTGSFALMQLATMATGSGPSMTVLIAPGSGTGELHGISGSLTITITGGEHHYSLSYRLEP